MMINGGRWKCFNVSLAIVFCYTDLWFSVINSDIKYQNLENRIRSKNFSWDNAYILCFIIYRHRGLCHLNVHLHVTILSWKAMNINCVAFLMLLVIFGSQHKINIKYRTLTGNHQVIVETTQYMGSKFVKYSSICLTLSQNLKVYS